jgi:hypothetical protein
VPYPVDSHLQIMQHVLQTGTMCSWDDHVSYQQHIAACTQAQASNTLCTQLAMVMISSSGLSAA